ncbi:MAG: N-acetyltransferase [Planctomycetota bacterium]|nr:N-acetyltransferase [Planctomycetota bacterium]
MSEYATYQPQRPAGERFGNDVIRPARLADAEAITALTCARHALDPAVVRPRIDTELLALDGSEAGCVFVAEIGHHLAGFARARRLRHGPDGVPAVLPEGWYLTGVIVDPAWRRRGLGSALTTARLAWLRRRSDVVHYVANRANGASIRLHEGLGFREIARGFSYPRAELSPEASVAYELMLP